MLHIIAKIAAYSMEFIYEYGMSARSAQWLGRVVGPWQNDPDSSQIAAIAAGESSISAVPFGSPFAPLQMNRKWNVEVVDEQRRQAVREVHGLLLLRD